MAYDPDLAASNDLDLDLLDFDERDTVETAALSRAVADATGYAERPGTIRPAFLAVGTLA